MKKIIFCADGTWNDPEQDDDKDGVADCTNVYKLYMALAGERSDHSDEPEKEQEKTVVKNGQPVQIAKYIHGVGSSSNPVKRVIGGTFGAGLIARIVRGYTFVSRNYDAGDDIVITGFSRGAYTARALGGLIASQGLLAKRLTENREKAYQCGAQAWYQYRYRKSAEKPGFLQKLGEIAADFKAYRTRDDLKPGDFVPVDRIKAVAVWDTVGSLGVPKYAAGGERVDPYRFADSVLSTKVELGLHAVALDEQREDFPPSLWTDAANVEQVVFAGAHSDVGGGYPAAESGLANIALGWIAGKLKDAGVEFGDGAFAAHVEDFKGCAHKPWLHGAFAVRRKVLRELAGKGLRAHKSVKDRIAAGPVLHGPGEAASPYAPAHWRD
jgi:uncharacterized protein (DUF2235 family)